MNGQKKTLKHNILAKKKSSSINMDPHKGYIVMKHGILIYPISEFEYKNRRGVQDFSCIKYQRWYIEVNNNGKKKTFDKIIKANEVNDAIWSTINYYYKLLTEKK